MKPRKKPDKTGLSLARHFCAKNLLRGELLVEERDGLDSAEIIFQRDVFVGGMRVFVGQSEAQQHAGNFECSCISVTKGMEPPSRMKTAFLRSQLQRVNAV